ncbi:MAG: hypothetical protein IKW03_08835 [Clostridia bacterium]|nr:hypothetical protein [Clostridia bacterium]
MSLITTLPDRLCEWFSDMNEFESYSFCTQYPSNLKVTPLEKPVIVFGTDKFTVLNNTVDEGSTIATNNRLVELEFTVGIHVPRTMGGMGCNAILDRIADLLLFNTSLKISGVTTDKTVYIRNTDSLFLKAKFTTSDILIKGSNYPAALPAN